MTSGHQSIAQAPAGDAPVHVDQQTHQLASETGPPGSGQPTAFPISSFEVDCFNADDLAAQFNGGSYLEIPKAVRERGNREFERFIQQHIDSGQSMAFETTLRSPGLGFALRGTLFDLLSKCVKRTMRLGAIS